MTTSTLATSASRASELATSRDIGRAFLIPEQSFFALSSVRHAVEVVSVATDNLIVSDHTNCDFNASVREDLDSWLGDEAGTEEKGFPTNYLASFTNTCDGVHTWRSPSLVRSRLALTFV